MAVPVRYTVLMDQAILQKIKLIVLFGSRARGHARPGSDYDVLYVALAPLTPKEWGDLLTASAELTGANEDKIDLIDANEASPLLAFEAARTGRAIYGSRRTFVDFVLRAWKQYQNTAKFRRFRERALAQHHGA